MLRRCLAASLIWIAATSISARDFHIDNVSGDDRNDGGSPSQVSDRVGPMRSIARALKAAGPGDQIILANTGEPYRESVTLQGGRHSSNGNRPFRIVGNQAVISNVGSAIFQIILLDLVFSIDSILTAVGMTDQLPIMVVAVLVAVTVMLLAADPLANFINENPTVVMLALGFLLMIGMVLIADGFGVHVPKGYIYAAMAFSALVEGLNMLSRKAQIRKAGG